MHVTIYEYIAFKQQCMNVLFCMTMCKWIVFM